LGAPGIRCCKDAEMSTRMEGKSKVKGKDDFLKKRRERAVEEGRRSANTASTGDGEGRVSAVVVMGPSFGRDETRWQR
jgi:hypothetical protein